jgi:hypothetical protein
MSSRQALKNHTEMIMVGCIVYTFDGSDEWHKTSFYSWLGRADDKLEILSDSATTSTFDLSKPHFFQGSDLNLIDQFIGKFAN